MVKGPLPPVGGVKHADILHPASGEVLDDALIVRVATDRLELHVHGGVAVVEGVMTALEAAGARVGGATSSTIEEDVTAALPLALTMTGARLVAAQGSEGLGAFVRDWTQRLERGEALWKLQSAVQWVLRRSERLRLLLDPARVAIIGAPNVGKSTLANALLGRTASITSDIAGTTRDWVESQCVFVWKPEARSQEPEVQVPVVLVDTAGVRETGDAIERVAIERTHEQVRGADAVVVVLDGSRPTTAAEMALVESYGHEQIPRVVVANKADLASQGDMSPGAVRVSALHSDGLDRLMRVVLQKLDLLEVDIVEPFAFTPRQRALLSALALSENPERAKAFLEHLR
jgi:tRNA modification GTPase